MPGRPGRHRLRRRAPGRPLIRRAAGQRRRKVHREPASLGPAAPRQNPPGGRRRRRRSLHGAAVRGQRQRRRRRRHRPPPPEREPFEADLLERPGHHGRMAGTRALARTNAPLEPFLAERKKGWRWLARGGEEGRGGALRSAGRLRLLFVAVGGRQAEEQKLVGFCSFLAAPTPKLGGRQRSQHAARGSCFIARGRRPPESGWLAGPAQI